MSKKLVVTDYNFPDLIHEEAAASSENAEFHAVDSNRKESILAVLADADVALVQFATIGA